MSIQYTANQLQRKFSGPPGTPGFARLGEVLRVEGKLDEAIQLCLDEIRVRPYELSGYLVLGKAYLDAGKVEEARQQFEDALKIDARCLSAMRFLADIMNKLQWGDAATVYYRSILAVDPWDAEIRALMAGTMNAPSNGTATLAYADPAAQSFTPAQNFAPPQDFTSPAQDYTPADTSPEETFEKPEGLTGDVMEVDLSGIADYLPDQESSTLTIPGHEDVSLEEGLTPASPQPFEASEPAEKPPISGQDVEDRLDSLFGGDDSFNEKNSTPAEPWAPPEIPNRESIMPAAASATATDTFQAVTIGEKPTVADETTFQERPAPQAEERVSGEDIEKRLDDLFSLTEEDQRSPTETSTLSLAVPEITEPGTRESISAERMPSEATESIEVDAQPDAFGAETQAVSQEDIVTSDDVGERLDRLFGVEAELPPKLAPEVMASESAKPWNDDLEQAPPDSSDIMSTESMLPVGWLEDAGEQPRITGADIEAQLDKLFDMEGQSDGLESGIRPKFEMPGEDADRTLIMPIMQDLDLKPKSEDWLAGRTEEAFSKPEPESIDFSSASETLMIPIDEMAGTQYLEQEPDFDATLEMSSGEGPKASDTASIEIIDGNDVSERLDELFTLDGTGVETTGMERPVTGEEVASRLSDIFEDNQETGEVGSEVPFNLETVAIPKADTVSQPLSPMLDEEEGYPEDEEMPSQTGVEGNVATVTLAEIYFNQGLKEQALQIYRQLLERESENESVRKRITEIEASQSEGENRGTDDQRPDPDSRRPRPGLKVPKRKK